MAKTCKMVETTKQGYVQVGSWTFDSGKITIRAKVGYERAMRETLDKKHLVDGKWVSLKEDPKAWFEALPSFFNGSMLNAVMVE